MSSMDGLTGDEVADVAYAQSSIDPAGLGLAMEILIYVLTVLCSVAVGLRIYVRTFRQDSKQPWGMNDYLAIIGFLPFIPASVFGVLAVRYGIGASDAYLEKFEMDEFIRVRGLEYLIYYELTYYAASTITKYAIAFTILSICMERKYIYLMYGIMGLMALTMAACLIGLFAGCTPFASYWNPKYGDCKSSAAFLAISYTGTAVQVMVDWTCAITPFFIVWSLQMPRRTKISVVVVLGLGILASVAALMRSVSYKYIDTQTYPNDHMMAQGRLLLWSIFESSFAIIACSLPPLKKLFKGCLERSTIGSKGTSRSRMGFHDDMPLHSRSAHGHMAGRASRDGARWDRLNDDDSSAKHILKTTEVKVDSKRNTSELSL